MPDPQDQRFVQTEVLSVDTCASTNELALRLGLEGRNPPFWVTAAAQTAGKGRDGRKWRSLRGNLHATLMLAFPRPMQASTQLAALTGIAVADAIEAAAAAPAPRKNAEQAEKQIPPIQLKWPNDVLLGGVKAPGKVAGILIETTTRPADGAFLIAIGIGINLAAAPENLDQPTTSLSGHGIDISPQSMLEQLDRSMAGWLARWQNGTSFDQIRERWHERSGAIGCRVNLLHADKPLDGICQGLDDDGALLLIDAKGRVQRITHGDVTLNKSDASSPLQPAVDYSRLD